VVIRVFDNGIEIDFDCIKINNNEVRSPNLDGRYEIRIDFVNDKKSHMISCIIDSLDKKSVENYGESGERLECISFEKGKLKLSIGIEIAEDYLDNAWGQNKDEDYYYDYLGNGIAFDIYRTTKSQILVFRIAWIDECNDDIEIQTWFGVDWIG